MQTKAQESNLPLKEYKFTFRLDNRATLSTRYFLAYDARDALHIFSQTMVKTLFKSSVTQGQESILAKEILVKHDPTSSENSGVSPLEISSSEEILPELKKQMDEFDQRFELITLEEYNRWAKKWYSLKIPLEEVFENK
jgi:hypothetical protein